MSNSDWASGAADTALSAEMANIRVTVNFRGPKSEAVPRMSNLHTGCSTELAYAAAKM